MSDPGLMHLLFVGAGLIIGWFLWGRNTQIHPDLQGAVKVLTDLLDEQNKQTSLQKTLVLLNTLQQQVKQTPGT
jgi:nicotinamide riboside transporter PnuC